MVRHRTAGIFLNPRARNSLPLGVTIRGINGEEISWASHGNEESLLWLTPERRNDGSFVTETRLNQKTREDVAEFWRLFYVVATRARDHLIFSIGTDSSWDRFEWSSWTEYMKDLLGLKNTRYDNKPAIKEVTLSKKRLIFGINDLPEGKRTIVSSMNKITPTNHNPSYESGCPHFVPSQINPSTFATIIECPRRYQYEYLWLDSSMRERYLGIGAIPARPPRTKSGRAISSDEWGTYIHEALRRWTFSIDYKSDPAVTNYIARFGKAAEKEFEIALQNFLSLPAGKAAIDATINSRQIKKEKTLSCLLNLSPKTPPVLVEGRVDLIFTDENGDLFLIDYKSEQKPESGTYIERIHNGQINSYVWLISKAMGVEVKKAYLLYIHPQAVEVEVQMDKSWFEEKAKMLTTLTYDNETGLKATPSKGKEGVCTYCPYNRTVGGPCENAGN